MSNYIAHNTPKELKAEEQIILQQIELLKSAFKSKVDILVKQQNDAIKELRESLTYTYELRIVGIKNTTWFLLVRTVNEDTTLLGDEFNKESWSYPFNIKNDVFYYSQDVWNSRSHLDINKILPEQGDTFTHEQLKSLVQELNNYPQI